VITGQDERTKFIFKNLVRAVNTLTLGYLMLVDIQVTHLHDFVRETSITTEEWMYVGKSSHPAKILTPKQDSHPIPNCDREEVQ
jgi:hypothetical protein